MYGWTMNTNKQPMSCEAQLAAQSIFCDDP